MTELDRLIEAVAAGDAIAATGHAKTITIKARDKGEIWPGFDVQKAMLRNDLNAAKALHDALLPEWRIITIRNRLGADGYEVRMQDQPLARRGAIRVCAEGPSMARAWLLAILRAYRATQETQNDRA